MFVVPHIALLKGCPSEPRPDLLAFLDRSNIGYTILLLLISMLALLLVMSLALPILTEAMCQ